MLLNACTTPVDTAPVQKTLLQLDLDSIKKRGRLIALTDNSSTSYFIYKGQPMGYEYELLNLFARSQGLDLEMIIVQDMDSIFDYLNNGVGDVIAANMTVTKDRAEVVSFSEHVILTRQMLIQRMPDNWWKINQDKINKSLIRNPIDLIGQDVHLRKNSSFFSRIQSLSDEIGGEINIVEVPGNMETEQLIELVAENEIKYTVADENVAKVNKLYYPQIDIRTPLSFPQRIAWATRNSSPTLLEAMDTWILENQNTSDFATVYARYFKARSAHKARVTSDYSSLSGGKISEYDELIQSGSTTIGWDWRLIASLIYQESEFKPQAESWTGATGLMQIMPETAEKYDVDSLSDPTQNIQAGIAHLKWLSDYWYDKIEDEEERVKFVLASYNVGLGHIIDSRRLTDKYGRNDLLWKDVSHYLKLKSRPAYYNDEVVKHGYCRGSEPIKYVREILTRYDHYKKAIS